MVPAALLEQFPEFSRDAIAAIPLIATLSEPQQTEVRVAFASSMSVIWKTMIGISSLGLLSVLLLEEKPMNRSTDEAYGLHDPKEKKIISLEAGIELQPTKLSEKTEQQREYVHAYSIGA